MPATLVYKPGYPTAAAPVETSATIGPDGLITASAVFVVPPASSAFPVNSSISPSLFSSLAGSTVQNLVVASRSQEKRNGLTLLTLGLVGVVNPPIVIFEVTTSPRSLSKQTVTDNDTTVVGGFDYLTEQCTAKTVYAAQTVFAFSPPTPKVRQIYNVVGDIAILQPNGLPQWGLGTSIFANAPLTARATIITSESTQTQNGIVTHTKTAELVYQ